MDGSRTPLQIQVRRSGASVLKSIIDACLNMKSVIWASKSYGSFMYSYLTKIGVTGCLPYIFTLGSLRSSGSIYCWAEAPLSGFECLGGLA